MEVKIYAYEAKSSLIDKKTFDVVDDFLLRSMHIEAIYSILKLIGKVKIEDLEGILNEGELRNLKFLKECTISDREKIEKISSILKEEKKRDFLILKIF
ncbi:hypothetical protein [Fervidicoccus fontis]|uniref:Uncharacterized protein n=1 Tax=Fervidicoccus fontis TaxID=683846 RepID=A0A2J6N5B5_9CREN|nr:hypothetical protein [Fervidicoccus fontis]PMB75801.1 MAG: hypothetical protein C0188_01685 [Fervidicoccus fontis]PMB76520.1 MAG: hypothetical protein C0177_05925 [Fervidicoccus fontis]HEW63876.1 hypothetical protein [Fervidicoccus fontis]